jgi:hypothetical protein
MFLLQAFLVPKWGQFVIATAFDGSVLRIEACLQLPGVKK